MKRGLEQCESISVRGMAESYNYVDAPFFIELLHFEA